MSISQLDEQDVHLTFIDSLILLIYLVFVLVIGWWRKASADASSFLLMGRSLTLPAFIATLVSTWYGGILGVSEYTYNYGISNWLVFGVPYYVFGIVFGIWLVPWARRSQVTTLPQLIERRYGQGAGMFASFWVLILASPAAYVLTLGFLLSFFFPLPLVPAMALGILLTSLYIVRGGLRSVVQTDILQFLFMFTGFLVMVALLVTNHGSPRQLFASLPPSHLQWDGGLGTRHVIVWFFIASWTLIDPGFHQRTYAADSTRTARRGVLWSVVLWLIFDLLTTLTGLYAYHLLPHLEEPNLAFLHLADQVLPMGLRGLFLVGILSTVMSTLDSTVLVSGMTLGQDLLPRIPFLERISKRWLLRGGVLLAMALAFLIAWLIPSVVDIWYTLGSLTVPALLLPVLWAYQDRYTVSPRIGILNMILAPTACGLWWLAASSGMLPAGLQYIQPFYAGLLLSFLLYGCGLLYSKPERKGHA